MKRIAIDEATSKLLDELTETSARRQSRAALVRTKSPPSSMIAKL
jgi:hypothetical protein